MPTVSGTLIVVPHFLFEQINAKWLTSSGAMLVVCSTVIYSFYRSHRTPVRLRVLEEMLMKGSMILAVLMFASLAATGQATKQNAPPPSVPLPDVAPSCEGIPGLRK